VYRTYLKHKANPYRAATAPSSAGRNPFKGEARLEPSTNAGHQLAALLRDLYSLFFPIYMVIAGLDPAWAAMIFAVSSLAANGLQPLLGCGRTASGGSSRCSSGSPSARWPCR